MYSRETVRQTKKCSPKTTDLAMIWIEADIISSVQSLSHVRLFVTPWTTACQASLSLTMSWSLLTHVHWVRDAIQPSLSSPSPAFNLSSIRVFSNESALPIQWSKYWNFSISLSNEYSGLISFRNNWFDHPAVQGSLKSLLQHQFESINSSTLSLLYHPALTFIHDYWKKHSFEYMDLCWQSNVFAF